MSLNGNSWASIVENCDCAIVCICEMIIFRENDPLFSPEEVHNDLKTGKTKNPFGR